MHTIELPWRNPDAFLSLWGDEPWLAMLDSGGPISERARWSILCRRPTRVIVTHRADPWPNLRALLPERQQPGPLPFHAGVIGLASYGAGLHREQISSRHNDPTPTLVAGFFDAALVFDRRDKRLWWTSQNDAPPPDPPACSSPIIAPPALKFSADQSPQAWRDAVESLIALIAAGDIFQANLTSRWHAARPSGFAVTDIYRTLRKRSPAPFGAMLKTPGFSLLSASVERFIQMDTQNNIETRPIKGTAAGHSDAAIDRTIAAALARDPKEYAENLMITDLMRNDIGRVCALGSVTVPELCVTERFAHLHHLVSSVRGHLLPTMDAIDLLRATLPPGSVTGAPKHRAMQIIDALETSARGAYCGSLFRIGIDGALDSSVVIRSITVTDDTIGIGAGGGITYPSNPQREYDEMCLKAAPLLELFDA